VRRKGRTDGYPTQGVVNCKRCGKPIPLWEQWRLWVQLMRDGWTPPERQSMAPRCDRCLSALLRIREWRAATLVQPEEGQEVALVGA
jgi:hypothetical protein